MSCSCCSSWPCKCTSQPFGSIIQSVACDTGALDLAAEALTEAHTEQQAPPPDPWQGRCSFQHPGTASERGSLSQSQPAHIRSQDALLALQGQDSPRLSLQSLHGDESNQQQPGQLQTAQEQSTLVSAPNPETLQRPEQDLFPGDLGGEGDQFLHLPKPRHPMHIPKRDARASSVFHTQEDKLQSQPSRHSLHFGRPKDAIIAVHREGSQSSHMSPFAGLAALTRTSMDERVDHRRTSMGHKPHRVSLEQAVGRDKFIRTVPQHMRVSVDAVPRARKSLEDRPPPPASSSGMRNSREACNSETAEQASARWTEQQRHVEASQQGQHQEQPSGMPTTIEESPCPSMSSQADSNTSNADNRWPPHAAATEMPQHDTHASGLSKFSPFASPSLLSAPAFD